MTATAAGRQLAREIRAELAAITPHRACCRQAEAVAFARYPSRAATARRAPLVRTALRIGRRPGGSIADWSWDGSAEHCRVAYLRGLFLTRGSLSITEGRAHLEFVIGGRDARHLAEQLTELGMPAGLRERRGRGVVTWKSAETIATFLGMAGAGPSLLDLEARRVARGLRGDLNRLLNAEAANLGRTVGSAMRQLEAIKTLAAAGRLGSLPRDAARVARARRAAPSATLAELAEATGLHRSHVQRELERIERLREIDRPGTTAAVAPGPSPGVSRSI